MVTGGSSLDRRMAQQFPTIESLDPVVGEFVNRICGRDPEGAAGWALSIVDPKSRRKQLIK